VEFVEPLFVVIEPDGTTREVPLTDSPIPAETNGDVVCLAGQPGAMLAVLSWGDGRTGVAVSPNGERWRGLDRTDGLDHIQVRACGRDATGRFVAAGQNGSGLAAVATSVDGSLWTVTALDDPGIVLGVEAIDGRLILTGAVTAADGRGADGALWAGDGDGWRRLEVSGLESDPFAPAVELTGLAARGEVVVAVGRDRGRAGAWVATRSAIDG
jgi:hypothetical protein